ncbi:FUSC family protein [Echinicola marina]|uniref:FUSC family membrane protein n=1 Tax=Echinicola marina TaxID=2859768 RepID=UPI001CF6BF8B|nr:FUSC family membrane protein [Echinicola marina]UCS95281.1 FUSC family protein [Echinicola marina]
MMLPFLVFYLQGNYVLGVYMALGALIVSLADTTGPRAYRRNGMLASCVSIFLSALVTVSLNTNVYLQAIQVPVFCFLFSMITVYGARASAVGLAGLLVMAISMGAISTGASSLKFAFFILIGGVWYTLFSLFISQVRLFRLAQQALGECVLRISKYLIVRSRYYFPSENLEQNNSQLAKLQVSVIEHQETVREILFKSRVKMEESIKPEQLLIVIFVDILDIFDQMISSHYEYEQLRKDYGRYGILEMFGKVIRMVADDLSLLGYALIANEKPKKNETRQAALEGLKAEIDSLGAKGVKTLVLNRIFANLRAISNRVEDIQNYFYEEQFTFIPQTWEESLSRFVGKQSFSLKLIRDNLSLESPVFRYALRLAAAAFVGFLLSQVSFLGKNSYWVVLGILLIMRPNFSLTKKRSLNQIVGTLVGGISGILILYFVEDYTLRMLILVLLIILANAFIRIRYFWSVVFMTPFIFIVFGFLYPGNDLQVARERVVDILLASGISFVFIKYFLPTWEYGGMKSLLKDSLKADLVYLSQIISSVQPEAFNELDYRLARKRMFMQTAKLSAAFQRMLDEPKRQQKNNELMLKLVVLNNTLSSYFSSLSHSLIEAKQELTSSSQFVLVKRSRNYLLRSLTHLGESGFEVDFGVLDNAEELLSSGGVVEDQLLTEQLTLIKKTCKDIERLSRSL